MELTEFFQAHPKLALAFSGGVDSAYLLYAAVSQGVDVRAYYVSSAFQPRFEREDAGRMAAELGTAMAVVDEDVLCRPEVAGNPPDRCYHCKRLLLQAAAARAEADGYHILIDGTNASDEAGDRPGMRALKELGVLSPLRMCGLTKDEIRRRSREAGLFTWDKPAYACLATRIPTGEAITREKLERTEWAEELLFSLGFTDFRVRSGGDAARIQVPAAQMELLMRHRKSIVRALKQRYSSVLLDMEARDEWAQAADENRTNVSHETRMEARDE